MPLAFTVHRLTGSHPDVPKIIQATTQNFSQGALDRPAYIIDHYTAGPSLEGTLRTFADPNRKASAHFVIGRDGTIAQCVGLCHPAWHAGESKWGDLIGLNNHSIGIEHVNAGFLKKVGKKFQTWWGGVVAESEVFVDPSGKPWHAYAEKQLLASRALHEALTGHLPSIVDVLGHEDIAPGRKVDPGPAFPLANLRGIVQGRA